MIPTEQIGSIARPVALIGAVQWPAGSTQAAGWMPLRRPGTRDDGGFSPYCDATARPRSRAIASIHAHVAGTALADAILMRGRP